MGKHYLTRSLEGYLKLCPISIQASHSWAFIHNGLSSALVLGLIGETKVNTEVRQLQGALIDALNRDFDNSTSSRANNLVFLSTHHERALEALKNLYNEKTTATQPNEGPQNNTSSMSAETPQVFVYIVVPDRDLGRGNLEQATNSQ
jgi:hypothetical protein